MLCAGALGVVALAGCADREQRAFAPTQWDRGEIRALEQPIAASSVAGAWVASAPASNVALLNTRRNGVLIPRPPAPITATSVWPGPPIRLEPRRIPVIYSHWGRAY